MLSSRESPPCCLFAFECSVCWQWTLNSALASDTESVGCCNLLNCSSLSFAFFRVQSSGSVHLCSAQCSAVHTMHTMQCSSQCSVTRSVGCCSVGALRLVVFCNQSVGCCDLLNCPSLSFAFVFSFQAMCTCALVQCAVQCHCESVGCCDLLNCAQSPLTFIHLKSFPCTSQPIFSPLLCNIISFSPLF